MSVPAERADEVERVQGSLVRWAHTRPDVRAVVVVGSWARGEARPDSDLDVIVLAIELATLIGDDGWIGRALGEPGSLVRRAQWGVVTERRVRLASGLVVELGLAPLTWAATDPVDPGTWAVVREGCRTLHDPLGIVARLLAAGG